MFKIIEEIIEKDIEDITILLVSDALEKVKLRNFLKNPEISICVPFYEDNLRTLNLMASNFFKEKNFIIATKYKSFS